MNTHIEADEKRQLQKIMILVNQNLEEKKRSIVKLGELDYDEYVFNDLVRQYATRIKILENALNTPYFARINYAEENKNDADCYYIGKASIFNGSDIAVVDWRAPISSVYYEGGLGHVSYMSPSGMVNGRLNLKRMYQIEHGDLLHFQDIDISTNDAFLQDFLSVNAEARLKNIVSTIQSEQNRIIRAEMEKPLIVQGVAGSGKTTVALHRIAYLAYTYEKAIKPEELLILAPNKFILDYVSGVLPDLGVDFVRQETVEEFATSIISGKIKIENTNARFAAVLSGSANYKDLGIAKEEAIVKFKTGMAFKEVIDAYLDGFHGAALSNRDFTIGLYTVLEHKQLQNIFMDFAERLSATARITRLKRFMLNWMENNAESIAVGIQSAAWRALDNLPKHLSEEEKDARKEALLDEVDTITGELRRGGKKFVADYIRRIKIAPVWDHYKTIMARNALFEPYLDHACILQMQKSFVSRAKKKSADHEDIPALLYIQYRIFGLDEKFSLKHVIIDEAQDFGLFLYFTLLQILGCKSMTILGDLAQGVFSYRGLDSWESLNDSVFEGEAAIAYMQISYRTTIEIMEEANKVLSKLKGRLHVDLAVPAIRHGRQVAYTQTDDAGKTFSVMQEQIGNLRREGYRTIAVICRTEKKSRAAYEYLAKNGMDVHLLVEGSPVYEGGIQVMPSYLSKGLEFDAVILMEADNDHYPTNDMDAKLLYVSMTRAMHSLDILYEDALTDLLR